jgi:hypothetical protein
MLQKIVTTRRTIGDCLRTFISENMFSRFSGKCTGGSLYSEN